MVLDPELKVTLNRGVELEDILFLAEDAPSEHCSFSLGSRDIPTCPGIRCVDVS